MYVVYVRVCNSHLCGTWTIQYVKFNLKFILYVHMHLCSQLYTTVYVAYSLLQYCMAKTMDV